MNNKLHALTALVATLVFGSVARAAVTTAGYSPFAYTLFNHLPGENIIQNGTFRMIIDANGTGGIGIAKADTWTWDANDFVLGELPIVDGVVLGGEPPFYLTSDQRTSYSIEDTDVIYGVWFERPFHSATPGNSTWYGFENMGIVDATPGDYSFTLTGGNTTLHTPDAAPVPEPSSICMGLAGLGLLAMRRRKVA